MRNRILLLNLLFFVTQILYSQDMKITYDMKYKEDSLSKETITRKMLLLIHEGQSKFYTEKQYEVDSLRATGFKGFAVGDSDFYVIRNKKDITSKYYFKLRDVYKVTVSQALNWRIENQVEKKFGFACQKATLHHKGRHWEAWFTQDIPLLEGPYIFKGLPGLIVYMKDSTGSYEFSFAGLKKNFYPMDFENISPQPLEVSEDNLKKISLDYYNDPFREMKSGNVKAKVRDQKGNEIEPDFREMTKNVQSYLKKNNNPIELSDAIKYP